MTRQIFMPGVCRACGCDDDHACVGEDGEPCSWVEPDLCSACAPDVDDAGGGYDPEVFDRIFGEE